MHDHSLLHHYQEELIYLRKLFARFAKEHPKIATRLRLDDKGMTEDADVEQLIESFAFSNAKLHHKLADDYAQISHPLLEMLAPHFLAPIPATSIVQLDANSELLVQHKHIAKNTLLQLKHDSHIMHFTTCYPVDIWPVDISYASFMAQPLQVPLIPVKHTSLNQNIKAALRISLRCLKPTLHWSEVAMDNLRFFIKGDENKFRIYEALMQQTVLIMLADSMTDATPVVISTQPPHAVGFAADEQLLPYSDRVKTGQRLLMDYAILPDKFLFFEIRDLQQALSEKFTRPGQNIELVFYLRATDSILEKKLTAHDFALHCTPIMNLFSEQVELPGPDALQTDIALTTHLTNPKHAEIFSILKLNGRSETNSQEFLNYQRVYHHTEQIYYQAKRVPAWQTPHYAEKSSEILLSFVDQQLQKVMLQDWKLTADVLRTNRDLPSQITTTPDNTIITLIQGGEETVMAVRLLQTFTPTRRPFLQKGACWRYLSHLSPNFLTLTSNAAGVNALRAVLQIYDFGDAAETSALPHSLLSVQCQKHFTRNPAANDGIAKPFWHGLNIVLHVDAAKTGQQSLYLTGCILERYLALYTTPNYFIRLSLTSTQDDLYQWPARKGEGVIL